MRALQMAPRLSGGVAHAMAVSVASGVGGRKFRGEKRRVFAASTTLRCDPDFPDNLVPFVRRMWAANRSRSRALPGSSVLEIVASSAANFDVGLRSRGGHHTWNQIDASAITATMLHLCSAPCKALRFAAPAHARGLRALTVPARR